MCGEKGAVKRVARCLGGSPPRVRGKAFPGRLQGSFPGITPACAGKSQTGLYGNTGKKDHPRVCGEKAAFHRLHLARLGSPPRVRGKDGRAVALAYGHRITPACAGKSAVPPWAAGPFQDHPRVCGEKSTRIAPKNCGSGSPPRVRGKGPSLPEAPSLWGITPACAGKRTLIMYRPPPR